ncbi:MAG: caspase family protein, partial [Treponema sp.]|nr:caspase family protein [Treponema sp.]
IEIYATNPTGMIEGERKKTIVSWQGKTQKPNLYVLAVGVNKYRDKSLWLNYAVPDASSISDTFKNAKGKLYQSINISTVFDADVTEAGITSAFDSVASKISPDDVFVFYISGHGTPHSDGDYYFIPVDFRFRNAQSVVESALSKKFITDQLSKIKAQKSLVLLDTCNSGAFISSGARGMAEKTAIDRLSRATGHATIAASSDTQSAMEGYKGHGIFTYVILEALSGKADLNKDGYISISELSVYAEEKVPDYSYDKWGYEQYPQVDLRKQSNFPLVGK